MQRRMDFQTDFFVRIRKSTALRLTGFGAPGNHRHIDSRRTSGTEYLGTLAGGSTGGHHIVDDDDVFSCDYLTIKPRYGKGIFNVFISLEIGQHALFLSGAVCF